MLSRHSINAMLLMTAGIATLVAMDAAVKVLVTDAIHTIQILALRSVLICPAMVLVYSYRGQLAKLRPQRVGLQTFRALVGFAAPCAFFISLAILPQADATVVFFLAPIIITICSVVFLGERFGVHRWVAVLAGFIGVAIALDPGVAGSVNQFGARGYLLALIGSITYAVLFLLGRHLSTTETTASLVMSYNVGVGAIALLALPWFWTTMTVQQFAVLLLLAVLAVIGHFLIVAAFTFAEASLLSPFEYSALFWAILFDWLLWHHAPNIQTVLGGSVVILAGLYFVYRERLSNSNATG